MRLLLLFFCYLVMAGFPVLAQEVTFPVSSLDIVTHEEKVHFTVEVATNDAQHARGLMWRKNLPKAHGMLFDFGHTQHADFWMKNTLIPLDMIFMNDHGTITQVVENATPESTAIISSDTDVRAVLEVMGGSATRYHIAKGDKVLYSGFP